MINRGSRGAHLNTSSKALQYGTTWSWVRKVLPLIDAVLRLMLKYPPSSTLKPTCTVRKCLRQPAKIWTTTCSTHCETSWQLPLFLKWLQSRYCMCFRLTLYLLHSAMDIASIGKETCNAIQQHMIPVLGSAISSSSLIWPPVHVLKG